MTQTVSPGQVKEKHSVETHAYEVLPEGVIPPDHSMMVVPLSRIRRNPSTDPRQHRNKASKDGMLESIRRDGVIQPIIIRPVTPSEEGEADFEVVAGNTRFDLSLEAAKTTIPSLIRHIGVRDAAIMAGVENMQRADLSPVEEGLHAAKLLTHNNNDYDEVCKLLDWSDSKLKSRIMLTHVSLYVQNALVQGDLKIGHVELLSGIPKSQQDNIAKKIIEENISVAETKERLASGTRQLAKACFPLDDCQGCRFNSSTVMDMFASVEASKKDFCSNARCWDEKTTKTISVIATDASETYGMVVRENEVAHDSYVHLQANSENGVGAEQKANCASCQYYGCIISTTFGTEGKVYGEQCFNLQCHAEKVTEYRTALDKIDGRDVDGASATPGDQADLTNTPSPAGAAESSKPAKKEEPKKTAPLSPATLKRGIKQEAFNRFVKMGEDALAGSERLGTAIALLTLQATFRKDYPEEITARATRILKRLETDAQSMESINPEVIDNKAMLLARLSTEELTTAITALASLTVWKRDTSQQMENHAPHQNAARYAQACKINRASYLAVTAEYLKAQTKSGVITDCQRSGFAEAYDSKHGEKAFSTLSKGKAGDLIKAIDAFVQEGGFDFHGYEPIGFAPEFYFEGM